MAVTRLKDFDKVYCVIDRDHHENFDEALLLADEKGIKVIVSYPCYEFWLLLHFRFTRAPYAAAGKMSAGDSLVKELRQELGMGNYQKGHDYNIFSSLVSQLPEARSRARQVMSQARNEDELNPSTQLHELIDALESLGTLRPAE